MLPAGESSGLRLPELAGGCPMGMRQAARGMLSSAQSSTGESRTSRKAWQIRRVEAEGVFLINRFTRGAASILLNLRCVKSTRGLLRHVAALPNVTNGHERPEVLRDVWALRVQTFH